MCTANCVFTAAHFAEQIVRAKRFRNGQRFAREGAGVNGRAWRGEYADQVRHVQEPNHIVEIRAVDR